MNILVVQRGARHRYAIPRMFQEAGMLTALYTDSSAFSPSGRTAVWLKNLGIKSPRVGALAARTPMGIPREKIFSHDNFFPYHQYEGLSAKYKKNGLQRADVLYSMCGEEFEFLCWAKSQGIKLAVDVVVHPGTERIVEEESLRYLGLSHKRVALIEFIENHCRQNFELADFILCPSRWVAEGVREYSPECADKIRVVPYGSSLPIRESINENPVAGRVLFAGREALRKGLHYLADAAQIVRARGLSIDIRVAGVTGNEVRWIQNESELNCLGNLPLNKMRHEYEKADVFVLPSLSEGQAGVVLEAMACGCPVIATRESGVDFLPGCGITIPSRDAQTLADAIDDMVSNRSYRKKLAEGALRQASAYSMEAWKKRLVAVVKEIK